MHPTPTPTGLLRRLFRLTAGALLVAFSASIASAIDVVRENNIWRVKWQDGTYQPCENNLFRAIETAVTSLPNTRTTKYTIRILAGSGSTYAVSGGPANLRGEGNFILDCGGASGMTFNLSSGSFIDARNANNSEIRNLNIIGTTTKIAVFFKDSNNVRFENINVRTPGGMIGLRPEGTWETNSYAKNIVVAGKNYFSGMATSNHGIETMAIDGFSISDTVTTRNTGGAGVLLNKTRNGYINLIDAQYASYDVNNAHNYAALRLANNCADTSGITVNTLKSYRCGRGFVIVTSETMAGVNMGRVEIAESANWGIVYTTGAAPNAPTVNNVKINSGYSINNAWDGLMVGTAYDCLFQDLNLSGNQRTGLTIAGNSERLRLIRVNVDGNAQASQFSWSSITDSTGSDLIN